MFKTSHFHAGKSRPHSASSTGRAFGTRAKAFALAVLFGLSCLPADSLSIHASAGETSASRRAPSIIEVRDPLPENYRWIEDYAYNVDIASGTITLLRCAAKGDATVYGCVLIDNIPFRTVIASRCFTDCPDLTSLRFVPGFGVEGGPDVAVDLKAKTESDMSRLFAGDTGLTALDLTGIDFTHATDLSYLCDGCAALTDLTLGEIVPAIDAASPCVSCAGMFRGCSLVSSIDLTGMDATAVTDMSCMFQGCANAAITWSRDFHTEHVTTMSHMFDGAASAVLKFDEYFRTGACTDMSYMLAGTSCPLDLRCFDMHLVTDMRGMFCGHRGDGTIDLRSPYFYTEQIKDMSYLFAMDYGTPEILFNDDVWSTANVRDYSYMFRGYGRSEDGSLTEELSAADLLSHMNFQNDFSMRGMFMGSGFTDIDLSGFKTGRCTDMSYLCKDAASLRTFTAGSFSGTDKCKTLRSMFENCVSLQNVIGYDSYYFYQTEDFAYMFKNCSSLEKMVIGSHSIQSARYLTGMFEGCSKAKDITFYFNHFNGVYNYDNFLGPDFELAKSGVIKLVNYNSTTPQPADKIPDLFPFGITGFPYKEDFVIYPAYQWVDEKYQTGTAAWDTDLPMYAHIFCRRVDKGYNNPITDTEGNSGPLKHTTSETLTVTINSVAANKATDEIKRTWFCPANHIDRATKTALRTNGNADTNYYEIIGYENEFVSASYEPTQDEWNATYNCCNKGYGVNDNKAGTAKQVDKSEDPYGLVSCLPEAFTFKGFVLRPRNTYTVTLNAPVYNLTGDSGLHHDVDPSAYPCFPAVPESITYGEGHAADHVIPALKQKGFTFLGWYDENGVCVSGEDGSALPNSSSNQILTPRFMIQEAKIILSAGSLPKGCDLSRSGIRIKPEQKGLWQGSNGTYAAIMTIKDGLFALPEAIYPPYADDDNIVTQTAWNEDDWYGSGAGKALPKNYVFDMGQYYPNYTAVWTSGRMTSEERESLQDRPNPQETINLIEGIDPVNPDPDAVKDAVARYLALSDEDKEKVPEEDKQLLEQAAKLVDQQEKLADAENEKKELTDQIQTLKEEKEATAAEAEAAKVEAAEAKKTAEEKIIEAKEANEKLADAQEKAAAAQETADRSQAAEKSALQKAAAAEQAAAEAEEKQREAENALEKAKDSIAEAEARQKAAEESEAKYREQAEESRKQQEDSAAKLAESSKEIEATKKEVADLEQQLSDANKTLEQLKKESADSKTAASSKQEEEAKAVKDLNDKNSKLEQELAEAKRMLQQLLAGKSTPANPYDTGWSFEPGTATPSNQPDTSYSHISSDAGKNGSRDGSAGSTSQTGNGKPSKDNSGTSANTAGTTGNSAGSAQTGSAAAAAAGDGNTGSSSQAANNASSGSSSAPSSSSSGSSSASRKSGSSYSGSYSSPSRSSSSYSYSGTSAASKNKSSYSSASPAAGSSASKDSASGKKSDTDEFLLSWLNETDSSGTGSSSGKSGSGTASGAGISSTDGGSPDTDASLNGEGEPKKAASSLGTSEEKAGSSSPLATILSIIGIGGATAAGVAFTWRRKRPVTRKERRNNRPL